MAVDLSALTAVLAKLESDDLAILESSLVPALLGLAVSATPVAYQPLENAIISALQPVLQTELAALLAKIPSP
jgi:hypothetical protein